LASDCDAGEQQLLGIQNPISLWAAPACLLLLDACWCDACPSGAIQKFWQHIPLPNMSFDSSFLVV
jgi:hypothetical protein